MDTKVPILFEHEKDCCGCSICSLVCPTESIVMIANKKGFSYPVINPSTCIGCRKCVSICVFKERQKANQ